MLLSQQITFIKIKALRTDNGGEFCKKEFEEFCEKYGIARQKTNPYTPQQNRVAERMNRTLMEKARSMLSGTGLGQEFWAEAVEIACYLVKKSPSSTLEDKTPHEVWTGKKPSLSHLRVFGCDAIKAYLSMYALAFDPVFPVAGLTKSTAPPVFGSQSLRCGLLRYSYC